ncbi:MAG: branched-chain amino acid aminotransferase I [Desulfobacterales bacterium SG8_35_2]|nr:MAG: branched-chain amino acid aminotransferase I [Desulfobacterales bacterium SG8_35_2]
MAPEDITEQNEEFEYVGFWPRLGATIIDSVLLSMIVYPLLYTIYGTHYFTDDRFIAGGGHFLVSYVLPAITIIAFWVYRSATPGKMAIRATIVDAKTFLQPSKGQLIGRYFAYYISTIPLGMGFLWIAWDPKKQGWHDKLAGTVVVRPVGIKAAEPVFET